MRPPGGLTRPGFAESLSENDRWALIDHVRARNAGVAMSAGGQWPHPVLAPDFAARCSDGRRLVIADLHDSVVRIVASDGQGTAFDAAPSAPGLITIVLRRDPPARPTAERCVAADSAAWAAYAVASGVDPDALVGTQFLVDTHGWLRARWRPGDPIDWTMPQDLLAAVTQIRTHPIAAAANRGGFRRSP